MSSTSSTSSTTSTGSLSMFDNTMRFLGAANSSGLDVNALIEADLQMMQAQDAPLQSQITNYQNEVTAWGQLKTQVASLATAAQGLRDINFDSNQVTLSSTGYADVTADNTAVPGTYTLAISNIATYNKVMSDAQSSSTTALGYSGTVQINGQNLAITSGMTLTDMANAINNGSYNANAVIINNHLVLTAKNSGAANQMTFTDDPSGILSGLGILNSTGTVKNQITAAQDANYSIDGISMTSATNTINGAVPGTTITLTAPTTSDITFTISTDQDTYVSQVQDFVNTYNATIKLLNTLTGKGGTLQGESTATSTKADMASTLYQATNSSLLLYQVGITVDPNAKDGSIAFDSSKLTSQLSTNSTSVTSLLNGIGSFTDNLYKVLNNFTQSSGQYDAMTTGLNDRITSINNTLAAHQTQYNQQQTALLNQMTSFESMMSSLNSETQYMNALLNPSSGSGS